MVFQTHLFSEVIWQMALIITRGVCGCASGPHFQYVRIEKVSVLMLIMP